MAVSKRVARKARIVGVDPQDFSPSLLRVQNQPPAPFARAMLHTLLILLFALILWATFGKLDVVATAEGKLIPQTYLKIVQPFEQGLISEILIAEGEHVKAGQTLMRLDTTLSDADGKAISADYLGKQITLRRIDAELADKEFKRNPADLEVLFNESLAQYRANRLAYQTALAEEHSVHDNTRQSRLLRRRLTFRLSRVSGGRSHKLDKTQAEVTKQQYRNGLLELKASQDGIIKDVATHTIGTVISPGTILMTLVPKDEILRAEVWVSNQDVGFIHLGEPAKIKFASYQFQKYGMVDGMVAHLSADATDNSQQGAGQSAPPNAKSPNGQPYSYRALVDLKAQELIVDGIRHALSPGMQVTAEIHLGTRTILEYLLSPVMGAFQEAGRER